jgi:hypothetical protein
VRREEIELAGGRRADNEVMPVMAHEFSIDEELAHREAEEDSFENL